MTAQEAINRLQNLQLVSKDLIALKTAISALEKQIPQKPIYDESKGLYVCPVCKELNAYAPDDFNDYCELCGQAIDNALDWSDDE